MARTRTPVLVRPSPCTVACLSLCPSSSFSLFLPPSLSLCSWLDAIVHPRRRVCSRQRVITIANRHETHLHGPVAAQHSATRGSFNIDNTLYPAARNLRFSPLSLFSAPSSFLAPFARVPLRYFRYSPPSLAADDYRRARRTGRVFALSHRFTPLPRPS